MKRDEDTFKLSKGRTLKIIESYGHSDDPEAARLQGLRILARIIAKAYLRGDLDEHFPKQ